LSAVFDKIAATSAYDFPYLKAFKALMSAADCAAVVGLQTCNAFKESM
jgi:hypothetical protein